MKSIRTIPTVHAAEGDERIRTAVPAPSTSYVYGLYLACGHRIEWGNAQTFDDAWAILGDAPRRKDGWYRAFHCQTCGRRRRTISGFVNLGMLT